jgi:isoleucyl-tRNA synthetase
MAQIEENAKKSETVAREERVLKFWEENKIFEKSLEQTEGKKEFIFYEGPPTANGKPGIHHLEARAFKDAIPRYKTMQGFHVRRKGGWDTHGLPVELQVEKKLGLNSKKAIEEYGISKFNQECKESVWEYVDLWQKFTNRIGYWLDNDNAYVTYHNPYIESVWNILKNVHEQKLLYKDYKVVPWCPRCGTALSSHELAQGYETVKDLSVYVKFKVKRTANGETPEDTYILAWTTTPWTLPGNLALAVGKDIKYIKVREGNEFLILAEARHSLLSGEHVIVEELKGSDLVGWEYEPLYPYLKDEMAVEEKPKLVKAFKIYDADFVTTEDGTGVVHTAVMYGQDDFVLGNKIGLPKHHMVGSDGKFLPGTGIFSGRNVKDEEVAVDVIKDLAGRGLLFKKEKYEHSYPHCWRCHTPLIYYARDSWYIKMSDPKIKGDMIKENQSIDWEPAHIREGRFGEWLREIKDWAISRERYWGTPLPVWQCEKCKKVEVIGSIKELQDKTVKSGNTYFIMRHGETESNTKNLVNTVMNSGSMLTEGGKEKIKESANKLKGEKIDLIISSPFNRTRETSKIVAGVLGLDVNNIVIDERLGEMQIPSYEGKSWIEYHKDFPKTVENFDKANPGDESYKDIRKRVAAALFDIEKKYQNKKILIVTHGGPAWLMLTAARMLDKEKTLELIRDSKDFHYLQNAEVQKLQFTPFPHDEESELDLHRPYIDEIELTCSCGGNLVRTKEVIDVWFDSGAMPFAQDHYPFENKEWIDGGLFSKGKGYPADYISEAIDQTRGWFYTLHAIGVLMGRGKAYKNVICLGHILDANGKKMSKSIGNIVDPWTMIEKHGVDTLRLWMYSVNQPGESKNFDEKTVQLLNQQVFGLLYNVLAFYELYRDKNLESDGEVKSSNILDQWILARLSEVIKESTEKLNDYKLLEPVRAVKDFINDLSTWYLRRSRDRIKEADTNDSKEAKQTLYYVLRNISKLLAPFAPFAAEDIWLKLKNEKDKESVHLVSWPTAQNINKEILTSMEIVRELANTGNRLRKANNIPLRQPLATFFVPASLNEGQIELIKEELNVKNVEQKEGEAHFDQLITPELKQEGDYRELVRALQDLRKKMSLTPNEVIDLSLETNMEGKELIQKFENDLKKVVLVSSVNFGGNDGEEVKAGDLVFKVKISK